MSTLKLSQGTLITTIASTDTLTVVPVGAATIKKIAFSDLLGSVNLVNEATDVLSLYRGTNAQALRLYNTRTDASNYELGVVKFASNLLTIGTEKAGTGTGRSILFSVPDPTTQAVYFGTPDTAGFALTKSAAIAGSSCWRLGATYVGCDKFAIISGAGACLSRFTSSGLDLAAIPIQMGTVFGSADVGLTRSAAGVMKVTDGAAGGGILLGTLRVANAYVPTPQSPTGYITIQDSTGTTYKIPCNV